MEIKIKIDGKEYTVEEAREIQNTLNDLFCMDSGIKHPPHTDPALIWPNYKMSRHDWPTPLYQPPVTCSSGVDDAVEWVAADFFGG